MVDLALRGRRAGALILALAAAAVAGGAQAQSMYANSANYNAGYGRSTDEENQPVDVSLRDANGNLTIADGVIEAGQDGSIFANTGAGGAADTVSGVGTSSNASIVTSTQVSVTERSSDGRYNNDRVTVDETQTNTGNATDTSSVSGGVSNAQ